MTKAQDLGRVGPIGYGPRAPDLRAAKRAKALADPGPEIPGRGGPRCPDATLTASRSADTEDTQRDGGRAGHEAGQREGGGALEVQRRGG